MRRTKDAAEETRQHILEAAIGIFAENGYTSTRLSDIAQKAKVTRGAIYWHFKDKKHLFTELLKDQINPFFSIVEQTIQEDTKPIQKLRNIIFRISRRILEDSKVEAFQKLAFVKTNMLQLEGLEDIVSGYFEKFDPLLSKVIKEGQDAGEIDDAFTVANISVHFYILMNGLGFMLTHPERRDKIKDHIEKIIDLEMKTLQK